ncbi:MAG: DUF1071 domain-containing protein [Fusobacterium sp.]
MEKQKFDELYSIDINPHIEKDYKGLSYLSWATAYKLAMDNDPNMSYEILEDNDGIPFFTRGQVNLVKTKVTMFGETKTMILPVMDNKHNAVSEPNSRQINDNIMRCLAKNIAMFGIGLPLYVGEDLAQFRQPEQPKSKVEDKKPFDRKQAEKCILELVGDNTDLLEKEMELKGIKSFAEADERMLKMLYKDIKARLQK